MLLEEVAKQLGAFLRHGPASHLGPMIEAGMAQQIAHRTGHARLLIPRAKYHPAHPGQDDGTGALGARLQRDIQRRIGQASLTHSGKGPLQREEFGMSGRVAAKHRLVVGLAQNHAVLNYHRTNRDLPGLGPQPGQFKSPIDPGAVLGPKRKLRH